MANPYPPLPNIIRCHLYFSDGKGTWGTRFFLNSTTSPYAAADLVYLATQISSYWSANLKNLTANSYSLTRVDCQDLGSTTGAVGTWQGNIVGSAGSNEMAANCAANIRYLIPDHYRGGHPIGHMPPASELQVQDARNWTGAFATSLATSFQAMMTSIGAISHGTVVNPFHTVPRHWRPGGTTAQVTFPNVSGYFAPTRFGTMRKRLTTRS